MQSLYSIIEKYGTDKNISGYSKIYETIFTNIKNQNLNILEVGIGSLDKNIKGNFSQILEGEFSKNYKQGGSLRVWKEYFINSKIFGIDIAEDCKIDEDRITTFIFDSTNFFSCQKNLNDLKFNIIIDDGSHDPEDQFNTLKNLFSRVEEGGFYIIEDLGGCGDGRNLFVDNKELVLNVIGDYPYFFDSNILVVSKNNKDINLLKPINKNQLNKSSNLTIVSGLWNLSKINRSFEHYLMCFEKFLEIKQNMFLFIPKELESFVWERRSKENTQVKIFELSDIKNMFSPFWERTQKIRTSSDWINQANWIIESPQGYLEYYNPIVMSKMSMLHDASIYDNFNTDNFIWLDAGITNTINYNLLIEGDFFTKLVDYLNPFLFIQYPYPYYGKGVGEIHGFNWEALNRFADNNIVEWICRGGLFGGKKEVLSQVNSYYWHMLNDTLAEGYMGTEESVFSILAARYPEIFRTSRININGHIQEFVEKVLNDTATLESIPEKRVKFKNAFVNTSELKTSVYMLTFNFPHQVEHTIQTWLKHPKWITNTRNILIDNSTNDEARIANAEICKKYNFEHIITNENTGINGGRFRAAQHFQESDSDYYLFLEDDMGLHEPVDGFCRNGFRTHIPNLYDKVLKIIHGSDVDFLKLSFTEVYMDNNIQVSWYNVPQVVRTEMWPDYDRLPQTGLDPNCPRTKFDIIEMVDGLSYITGDIYYANWPMIVGKKGNQKMFLDVTWHRPYEQTWMSYMFQETRKGNLKPAVLLASPINHNRIAHYKPEERREN